MASSQEPKISSPSGGSFHNFFFETELFRITLTDPNERVILCQPDPITLGNVIGRAFPSTRGIVFYVHKGLLTSLSPELEKHVNNSMKEGLSGEMTLGGVDTKTMQWFLQWAYRGECVFDVTRKQDLKTWLECYLKLYVLSDRFNIGGLQDFCYTKILQLLPKLKLKNTVQQGWLQDQSPNQTTVPQEDMVSLLKAAHYLADNIPRVSSDKLIGCLAKGISFALDSIKVLPEFSALVRAYPEFALAVLMAASPAVNPPWPKEYMVTESPRHSISVISRRREF